MLPSQLSLDSKLQKRSSRHQSDRARAQRANTSSISGSEREKEQDNNYFSMVNLKNHKPADIISESIIMPNMQPQKSTSSK